MDTKPVTFLDLFSSDPSERQRALDKLKSDPRAYKLVAETLGIEG